MFNYGSPYYMPAYPYQQQQQPVTQQTPFQPTQGVQQPAQNVRLQGKSVDSIEVVKAMEIPLDGTVSYFPLIDGTAIVTKQLQMDGTSKTTVYKPVTKEEDVKEHYITKEELDGIVSENEDIREEFKDLKRQVKDIANDLKAIKQRKD